VKRGAAERALRAAIALLPWDLRERVGAEIELTARLGEMDVVIESQFDTRRSIVDQLLSDVRFAGRSLRRRPLMLGLAIASVALGIGASVAMFSVVNTVLLRPLPFGQPNQLVAVYPTWPKLLDNPTFGELALRGTFSWAEFWDVQARQTSFEAIGGYDYGSAVLSGTGEPRQIPLGLASPGLFQMLRVNPALGALLPTRGGDEHIALLTDGAWRRRFGAQASAVGATIDLGGTRYRVVGVLPPGIEDALTNVDVWLPRPPSPRDADQRGNHTGLRAIGRLKPGVTVEQARVQVAQILAATTPPNHGDHGASVYALQPDRMRHVRTPLLLLLAAAGLLLLVGCTNVAAILLGAGLERRHEIAVRSALGASRARVARQLLTESVVLAVVGSACGVLLAMATLRGLAWLAPVGVPRIAEASIDMTALLVALALALVCGVLFGVIPAFNLSRRSPAAALSSSRGLVAGMARGQAIVVVGELALATMLVVSGGLLTRTLLALNGVDPGFRADDVVAVQLSLPYQRFRTLTSDSADRALAAYFDGIVANVRAVPGVTGVAIASSAPFVGGRANNDVNPDGYQSPSGGGLVAERRFVSGNFFQTMGVRMVQGRAFRDDDDREGAAPAVVISEGLAEHVWPGQSAIGKHLSFWGRPPATVVGVAAGIRDLSVDSPTQFAFYVPFRQFGAEVGDLLVRTNLAPASLAASLRAAVRAADPAIAISRVDPYRVVMAHQVAEQRFRARLMAVFAALAAVFAALGVYGVTARAVARQTREIGVRVALGAEPRRVFTGVVGSAVRLSIMGAVLGIAGAIAAGRAVERMLYGVTATDPLTLGAAVVAMLAVGVLAAAQPGRRATRISPMEALRAE